MELCNIHPSVLKNLIHSIHERLQTMLKMNWDKVVTTLDVYISTCLLYASFGEGNEFLGDSVVILS